MSEGANMSKLNMSRVWSAAVAYVSLLVGAGLSVAGNLADTYRVRGALVDGVDIVLAVGPPLATLLVAELFVSSWPRKASVQSVRWVATLVVGLLATIVSWLHINELLVARGQLTLVAILWPVAIDGLAIMAMAKILVVRAERLATVSTVANEHVAKIQDMPMATMATQPIEPAWTPEDQAMLDAFERDMDKLDAVAIAPVSPAPALARSNEVKPESVPAEAAALSLAWERTAKADRPTAADRNALLAAAYGVSPRTARRWHEAVVRTASVQ